MSLCHAFYIQCCQLVHCFMIVEPIKLMESDAAYMAQISNAMCILWVSLIMMCPLIGSLPIPIEARTLDTNCELVSRNNFVTPTCDMNPFRLRFNQERIVVSLIRITRQIEQCRVTPLTAGGNANHVREHFFRVLIFTQDHI